MAIDLQTPSQDIEHLTLSKLDAILVRSIGPTWYEYEDETISIQLRLAFTPLLVDKVNLLRILHLRPEMFYEEFLFFVHAVEVCNNHVSNFEFLPIPTSLEIAFAVDEIGRIVSGEFSDGIKTAVTRMLKEEGFSEAPGPLALVSFEDRLVEGQDREDIDAKYSAVTEYVNSMKEGKND